MTRTSRFRWRRRCTSRAPTPPAPPPPAAEPGVGANTSASIPTAGAVAGGGGSTSSQSESTTNNQNAFGSTEQTIATPAGKDKVVSATVLVPRSYFVAAYKTANKDKEPGENELQDVRQRTAHELQGPGENRDGPEGRQRTISMGMYLDLMPSLAPPPVAAATNASVALLTSHTKEIALGVLAVVSLFMMSSMVRKSAPAPSVVMAGAGGGLAGGMGMPGAIGGLGGIGGVGGMSIPAAAKVLGGGDMSVGEAIGGGNMLDGVEMDEKRYPHSADARAGVDDGEGETRTTPRRW